MHTPQLLQSSPLQPVMFHSSCMSALPQNPTTFNQSQCLPVQHTEYYRCKLYIAHLRNSTLQRRYVARRYSTHSVIILIIQNLYSAIMPLGSYRGAGGTGR